MKAKSKPVKGKEKMIAKKDVGSEGGTVVLSEKENPEGAAVLSTKQIEEFVAQAKSRNIVIDIKHDFYARKAKIRDKDGNEREVELYVLNSSGADKARVAYGISFDRFETKQDTIFGKGFYIYTVYGRIKTDNGDVTNFATKGISLDLYREELQEDGKRKIAKGWKTQPQIDEEPSGEPNCCTKAYEWWKRQHALVVIPQP